MKNPVWAIMCRKCGTDLFPIDIGMAMDTPRTEKHKIAHGTKNMAEEPAMTREEALTAIRVGMAKVRELKEQGYQLIATGEMGIGNTTTSSAIAAAFLDLPAETVTGRGAGLSSEGLSRKIRVIREALKLHQPDPSDPLDVLAKVGGFDIAGLAGVFLGGAVLGIPVVIDGGDLRRGGADCPADRPGLRGLYDRFPCVRGACFPSAFAGAGQRAVSHLRDASGRGQRRCGAVPAAGFRVGDLS